jgi:hypothetical protein
MMKMMRLPRGLFVAKNYFNVKNFRLKKKSFRHFEEEVDIQQGRTNELHHR